MNATTVRKKRLEQLLELAQAYKGWSRKELARALRRDPTKLVPGTGIPKLDFVVELSGVLDWPVGDVAGFLWSRRPHGRFGADGADFDSLNRAAGEAHRSGRYELMLDLARQAYSVAATPEQRARACNRESGALDGLGRYTEVLQAIKRGMQEVGVAPEFRRMLQSNLANRNEPPAEQDRPQDTRVRVLRVRAHVSARDLHGAAAVPRAGGLGHPRPPAGLRPVLGAGLGV
ncbi:MAG: hypothetical protein ACYSW1_09845 [Planctomycetota bacterium]|jgi:ribosomal protein S18 acetylase RimI-like enzyme